jgi:hypothetical protein
MQELELTWNQTLRAWWLWAWRTFVGGFVIAAVVGFIVGFIFTLAGVGQYSTVVGSILGYFIGFVWSIFTLRMMLRKTYADFRFAVVPVVEATTSNR